MASESISVLSEVRGGYDAGSEGRVVGRGEGSSASADIAGGEEGACGECGEGGGGTGWGRWWRSDGSFVRRWGGGGGVDV